MDPSLGSEVLERGLHLGLVELEALGQRRGERVAHLLVPGLVVGAQLLERGLDLGLGDPERLRERGGAVAPALLVVLAELVAQVAEGLLELGLGHAERLGERGAAVAAAPGVMGLIERGTDLRRADAELLGQRGGEAGAALAAETALRAHRTERVAELGLGDAERVRERLHAVLTIAADRAEVGARVLEGLPQGGGGNPEPAREAVERRAEARAAAVAGTAAAEAGVTGCGSRGRRGGGRLGAGAAAAGLAADRVRGEGQRDGAAEDQCGGLCLGRHRSNDRRAG